MEFKDLSKECIKDFFSACSQIGNMQKNKVNPHFKSQYVSLDAALEAIKPALYDNNFALLQPTTCNNQFVEVETILLHVSGQSIKTLSVLPLGKNDPQGFGSAATYGRRYALFNLFGIAGEDDDGNGGYRPPPKQVVKAPVKSKDIDGGEVPLLKDDVEDLSKELVNLLSSGGDIEKARALLSTKKALSVKERSLKEYQNMCSVAKAHFEQEEKNYNLTEEEYHD